MSKIKFKIILNLVEYNLTQYANTFVYVLFKKAFNAISKFLLLNSNEMSLKSNENDNKCDKYVCVTVN